MEAGFAVGVDEAGRQVYRLDIQYDGSAFYGWSRQPELPTVEGSLRTALGMVIGEEPRLTVAGRTDAGVHARLDVERVRRGLDALTPHELAVTGLEPASPGFDARRDVMARSYRYFLWVGETANPF